MRDLSAAELLDVWERGSAQLPAERAISILAAAHGQVEPDALAALSVGRRDGLLLSVRQAAFGRRLSAIADCPDCHEQLELGFNVDELRLSQPDGDFEASARLNIAGYEVSFRLPDSRDLIAAGASEDVESARRILLSRCVVAARNDSVDLSVDRLPGEVIDKLEQEMASRDAQANVELELQCPSCRCDWFAAFDILSFFWSELDAWAQRLLVEVHKLGSAYGWSEADILEMSAARRDIYLNMVSG